MAGVQSEEVGDHACGEEGTTDGGKSTWVMPWERQPSWMYLPHLLDRAEAEQRNGAEEQQPAGASSGDGASGSVAIGSGSQSHGADRTARDDRAGDGCAEHAIRGQRMMPGPEAEVRRNAEGDGAATARTVIRGPPTEPGARNGGGARATAQQRLEARNAHLSISLAQHAERVSKRLRENPMAGGGPTPSERVAALRRRIEERRMRGQTLEAASDLGGGQSSAHRMEEQGRESPTAWSNEDPDKIHQCMRVGSNVIGIRMDTAGGGGGAGRGGGAGCRGAMMESVARGGGRSSGAGGAAVGVETAADWAAGHVAWHTSSRANGAGE